MFAVFAALWLAKLFNSILSFTLLLFTIPLAFDVGGRDCGLVRDPFPRRPPHLPLPFRLLILELPNRRIRCR